MTEADEAGRIYARLTRLTLLLWLGGTCLAADSLWHARPLREVVIYGSAGSVEHLEIDADLHGDQVRLKVRHDGAQFIAFPASRDYDVWTPRLDRPATRWLSQKSGRFILRLAVNLRLPPTRARLTLRAPGLAEASLPNFELRALDPDARHLEGVAPPITLKPVTTPRPIAPAPASPAGEDSEEPPELLSPAVTEELELRGRAQAALTNLNRLPMRELRGLVHSIQATPRAHPRTQAIGQALSGILQRKLQFLSFLDGREGSFRQSPPELLFVSEDESAVAPLSEN